VAKTHNAATPTMNGANLRSQGTKTSPVASGGTANPKEATIATSSREGYHTQRLAI